MFGTLIGTDFEQALEKWYPEVNNDGEIAEDIDGNHLDSNEDIDGDGNLDVAEDIDGDGISILQKTLTVTAI